MNSPSLQNNSRDLLLSVIPFVSGDESTLFESVQVDDLTSLPESSKDLTVSVIGYAIQTVGYDPANPDEAFADAKGE